jgi:hypothetical protein
MAIARYKGQVDRVWNTLSGRLKHTFGYMYFRHSIAKGL